MNKILISDSKIIKFKKIHSQGNGVLTPVYNNIDIPFNLKRVYYIYDIPSAAERGGHAHKSQSSVIIAASGSFNVIISDGINKKEIHLNDPSHGLFVPAMLWRELNNFSNGSVCLVLASIKYNEEDYYRNYDNFIDSR